MHDNNTLIHTNGLSIMWNDHDVERIQIPSKKVLAVVANKAWEVFS